MKLNFFLLSLLFLSVKLLSGQPYGCPDIEAWNYDPEVDDGSPAYCIYTQDCSEGYENRVFALSGNEIHEGSIIYLISTDLVDTLAVHEFVDLGWEGTGSGGNSLFNHFDACMGIGQCYFLDIHMPDSLYYLNIAFIQYSSYGYPTNITPFQPLEYSTDHRRALVGHDYEPCGVLGCMDPSASNYNPSANFDFGCQYCEGSAGVVVSADFTFNGNTPWQIRNDEGIVASGSFSEDSPQLTDLVCLDEGCYEFRIYGDDYHFNEISLTTMDDSLLTTMTLTEDSEAIFPFGIEADGCLDSNVVYGCTNPLGMNYDPDATVDDGSCDLQNDECGISLEAYMDSSGEFLIIDPDFYTSDYPVTILWDMGDGTEVFDEGLGDTYLYDNPGVFTVCATIYSWQFFEYLPLCYEQTCIEIDATEFGFSDGFPVFLNDGTASAGQVSFDKKLVFYPNPARNLVTVGGISGPAESVQLFSLDGKSINYSLNAHHSEGRLLLDVSSLAEGVYLVSVLSNGDFFTGRLLVLE